MKILSKAGLFITILSFPLALYSKSLHLKTPTEEISLTFKKLTKDLSSLSLTIHDPVHDREMTYECFPLKPLLQTYGSLKEKPNQKITFESTDGYKITKDLSIIEQGSPCLAYKEEGNPKNWTPYKQGKEKITFAPFYLIWKKSQSKSQRPWPYQLSTISIHSQSSKALKRPGKKFSRERKGFNLYKNHCQKCHSLNLQGGTLGPELNVPKNVTEYWDKKVILKFVANPEEFRLRSKMPAFEDVLTKKEIRNIYDYLVYMKERKKSNQE